MNKEKKITLIICFAIYALIILLIMINEQMHYIGEEIGLAGLLLGVAYFFISLILMISKQTRKVGAAVLLSAGIIILIGLGVCSIHPVRLNLILAI